MRGKERESGLEDFGSCFFWVERETEVVKKKRRRTIELQRAMIERVLEREAETGGLKWEL